MNTQPAAAGMRHAATQLRSKSDRVATVLSRVNAQVAAMTYAGPAADQLRAAMSHEQSAMKESVRILGEAADIMDRGAARLEADPLAFGAAWAGGTI